MTGLLTRPRFKHHSVFCGKMLGINRLASFIVSISLPVTDQLLFCLDLQIIFYPFDAAHLTGELFSVLLLLLRFHDAVE